MMRDCLLSTGLTPTLIATPAAAECYSITDAQKLDAVFSWLDQHFDWGGGAAFPTDEDNTFEVDFDLYPNGYCVLRLKVDNTCGVEVVEVVGGDAC